jgi:hypothetical protein
MSQVQITISEPIPDLECDNCGKEYRYDPLMGWGCLVLLDQRNIPNTILGSWCDEACLNEWLDTPEAKSLLAPGM